MGRHDCTPKDLEAAYVGSAVAGLMTGQERIKAQVTLSATGIECIPTHNYDSQLPSSRECH